MLLLEYSLRYLFSASSQFFRVSHNLVIINKSILSKGEGDMFEKTVSKQTVYKGGIFDVDVQSN